MNNRDTQTAPITKAILDLCESYDGANARGLEGGLTLNDVWGLPFDEAVRKMDEVSAKTA